MASYDASGEESGSDYITEVLYINLDTASQMVWAGSVQDNKGCFAFIQVLYATSQSSLRPHISVRVFTKDVEDDTAPAVMVVQRKHVLYESVLDGASRVDRIIFGLQISNAGFRMTLHKKVLVGTCMHSRRVCVFLEFSRLFFAWSVCSVDSPKARRFHISNAFFTRSKKHTQAGPTALCCSFSTSKWTLCLSRNSKGVWGVVRKRCLACPRRFTHTLTRR